MAAIIRYFNALYLDLYVIDGRTNALQSLDIVQLWGCRCNVSERVCF